MTQSLNHPTFAIALSVVDESTQIGSFNKHGYFTLSSKEMQWLERGE